MKNALMIRAFDKAKDYEMACRWWEEHGRIAAPVGMLPALGIVVYREFDGEDLAAMWLYLDNSVGVCFLERAVTRPGLNVSTARDALMRGIDYLKLAAREMKYGVMCVRTYPAMARFLQNAPGFSEDERPVRCLMTSTAKEVQNG